jgi:hypothetical protein
MQFSLLLPHISAGNHLQERKKITYVADTFGSGNNMHSKSLFKGLSMHQQPAK